MQIKWNKRKRRTRKADALIMRVANNIRHFRRQKGKTQEWLEENTGLNISRYESGKHEMTLTTISILSKHLNIEPYQLLN